MKYLYSFFTGKTSVSYYKGYKMVRTDGEIALFKASGGFIGYYDESNLRLVKNLISLAS